MNMRLSEVHIALLQDLSQVSRFCLQTEEMQSTPCAVEFERVTNDEGGAGYIPLQQVPIYHMHSSRQVWHHVLQANAQKDARASCCIQHPSLHVRRV